MGTRLIYLLLFMAPQVLIYLYLRGRLPDPLDPGRARLVRVGLGAVFALFNLPWLIVGWRVLFAGSVWGVGRIPFTGPWIAWQLLGWIYCALVAVYVLGKGVWWLAGKLRGAWYVVAARALDSPAAHLTEPLTTHHALMSRRRFLARATYAYAGAGAALSGSGIWSAYQLPDVTRRTLVFPDLDLPGFARALELARQSPDFAQTGSGPLTRYRARFQLGDAARLREVFGVVGRSAATEILVDDQTWPYGRELWIPLVSFFINP